MTNLPGAGNKALELRSQTIHSFVSPIPENNADASTAVDAVYATITPVDCAK
jgi:hypothetical protein